MSAGFLPILESKRDGHSLQPAEWAAFVQGVVAGSIPDYQIAAFLMAVYFRGLDDAETAALTRCMRDSGEVLEFPADPRPRVDKHSTGGIGDKVSLPLAPLLACLGFRVPMIAGRGLGITGGTLDKLESIPGFRTRLSRDEIVDVVQRHGCCIAGQTERMVPADRVLYALRDVTGTVPSIPLIVASILSKKLAESIEALVLNVTFGRGAFMPDRAAAEQLARHLVHLATDCGVRTRALITSMDTPLGSSLGNWVEVQESMACLRGAGPVELRELVVEFAACLLEQTGRVTSREAGRERAQSELGSGRPMERWEAMVAAQGGDVEQMRTALALESRAACVREWRAKRSGFVTDCDARLLGEIVRELGAGRWVQNDSIRPEVGIDRLLKPGTEVRAGDCLLRLHAADSGSVERVEARLVRAVTVGDAPPPPAPLIWAEIDGETPAVTRG